MIFQSVFKIIVNIQCCFSIFWQQFYAFTPRKHSCDSRVISSGENKVNERWKIVRSFGKKIGKLITAVFAQFVYTINHNNYWQMPSVYLQTQWLRNQRIEQL